MPSGPAIEALIAALPHAVDRELVHLALCHRSYCAEVPGEQSNERLEFLGDSVLGVVVTEHLYRTRAELPEGDLARIKAAVVSSEALAPVAEHLGVGAALLLGRGEEHSGGREKPSLLADALEALIGAVHLSGGIDAARPFVLDLLTETIDAEAARAVLGDAKNTLQELAARRGAPAPRYRIADRGPDHAKWFTAEVQAGELRGRGEGRSKKVAERLAAEDALAAAATSDPPEAGAARPVVPEPTVPGSTVPGSTVPEPHRA